MKGDQEEEKGEGLGGLKMGLTSMYSDWQVGDDLKIVRTVGSGVYATVAEAAHEQTGRVLAVKRFENLFYSELKQTRFLRELMILRQLKHPCINKMVGFAHPPDL